MSTTGRAERLPDPELVRSFVPQFIDSWSGRRIVSPDNPYVAVVAPSKVSFIDHRYSPEDAQYIKDHLEQLLGHRGDVYMKIDEIEVTLEVKKVGTDRTLFVFNPAYARVMFPHSFNRLNPALNLPERDDEEGPWIKEYVEMHDAFQASSSAARLRYMAKDGSSCPICQHYGVPDCRDSAVHFSANKVDLPRNSNEADAEYYQRMDRLHWGTRTTSHA